MGFINQRSGFCLFLPEGRLIGVCDRSFLPLLRGEISGVSRVSEAHSGPVFCCNGCIGVLKMLGCAVDGARLSAIP